MADLTKILAQNGINIDSIIICHNDTHKSEVVVRLDNRAEGFDDIKNLLENRGYKVIHVVKIG